MDGGGSSDGTGLPARLRCSNDDAWVEGVGATVWSPKTESYSTLAWPGVLSGV
jgi:hypothetical protein